MPERLVACPDCGNELSLSAELKGHAAVRCPSCGGAVSLPEDLRPPPPPPPPARPPRPFVAQPRRSSIAAEPAPIPAVPEATPVEREQPSPDRAQDDPGEPGVREGVLAGFRIRLLGRDALLLNEEISPLKLILFAVAVFFALVLSAAAIVFVASAGEDLEWVRRLKFVKAVIGAGFLLAVGGGVIWAFFYTLWDMGASVRFDRLDGEATFLRLFGMRRTTWPLKRIQAVSLHCRHRETDYDHTFDAVALTLVSRGDRLPMGLAERLVADDQAAEVVRLAGLLSHYLDVPLRIDDKLQHGPKRLREAMERVSKPPAPYPTAPANTLKSEIRMSKP